MKKHSSLFLLMFVIVIQSFSQKENGLKISPPIHDAIIYMNGAQIRYQVNVNLQAGTNTIVFEKLSPKLIPSSIRITTDENVAVLSIKHKMTEKMQLEANSKLLKVLDSIKNTQHKLVAIDDEKNSLVLQKEMLTKNQAIGGENTGVNFLDLQKAVEYYQQKMAEINKKISTLNEEYNIHSALMIKLNSRELKLREEANIPYSEINLQLQAKTIQSAEIQFSYVVTDAGWMPYYDLRCDDLSQPITLFYRAKAYNNCGIDFENLNLTLSTSDPLKSIKAPELNTWYLSGYDNIMRNYTINSNKPDDMDYNMQQEINQTHNEVGGKQKMQQVSMQQIQVPELSIDFVLKNKYSLPSEPNPYILEIGEFKMQATYDYVCVPAIEKSAFLNACFTEWEEMNLLEGNANVYLNGTYIGQSYINPNEIIDTLKISLGRDSKILVDRVKQKQYNSKMFIGNKQKVSFVYELSSHPTKII